MSTNQIFLILDTYIKYEICVQYSKLSREGIIYLLMGKGGLFQNVSKSTKQRQTLHCIIILLKHPVTLQLVMKYSTIIFTLNFIKMSRTVMHSF